MEEPGPEMLYFLALPAGRRGDAGAYTELRRVFAELDAKAKRDLAR